MLQKFPINLSNKQKYNLPQSNAKSYPYFESSNYAVLQNGNYFKFTLIAFTFYSVFNKFQIISFEEICLLTEKEFTFSNDFMLYSSILYLK